MVIGRKSVQGRIVLDLELFTAQSGKEYITLQISQILARKMQGSARKTAGLLLYTCAFYLCRTCGVLQRV